MLFPPNNTANTQIVIKADSLEKLKYIPFKKTVVQTDVIAHTQYFIWLLPESATE